MQYNYTYNIAVHRCLYTKKDSSYSYTKHESNRQVIPRKNEQVSLHKNNTSYIHKWTSDTGTVSLQTLSQLEHTSILQMHFFLIGILDCTTTQVPLNHHPAQSRIQQTTYILEMLLLNKVCHVRGNIASRLSSRLRVKKRSLT